MKQSSRLLNTKKKSEKNTNKQANKNVSTSEKTQKNPISMKVTNELLAYAFEEVQNEVMVVQ